LFSLTYEDLAAYDETGMSNSGRLRGHQFIGVVGALAAFAALASGPAKATTVVFSTGAQTLGGGQVNAQATFSIDTVDKLITVTVLDMEQNPTDVGQLISSVQFTVSNISSGTPTVQSSDGTTEIDVGNTTSEAATSVTPLAMDWGVGRINTNVIALCTICPSGVTGDPPQQLLIGDPNSSNNLYTNANGSINGNPAHNPFLLASGTNTLGSISGYSGSSPQWTISIPTLAANSTVTSVTFGFGTTYGQYDFTDNTPLTAAPEPSSWVLIGIGIFLICVRRVRIAQ